ncbi:MAG: HAD family phosphatase [Nitrospiraceae bacterium]
MLRAIIFDFDGVIADTEPLHFRAFQQVLAGIGLSMSEAEYYADYLGFDDRGCFITALAANGHPTPADTIHSLMERKAAAYLDAVRRHLVVLPGVPAFVQQASRQYPLAIASGALRPEIELILRTIGLRDCFQEITSAEDVVRGKPDPEPFLLALERVNKSSGTAATAPIKPGECLVIEDSIPGIRSGKAAGMKVLAVANTHAIGDLAEAHAITPGLDQVDLQELTGRLWGPG